MVHEETVGIRRKKRISGRNDWCQLLARLTYKLQGEVVGPDSRTLCIVVSVFIAHVCIVEGTIASRFARLQQGIFKS